MARSSHHSRREGGRYDLQIRLRSLTPRSPNRFVRFSLGTSDYAAARHLLADRMAWLLPLGEAAITAASPFECQPRTKVRMSLLTTSAWVVAMPWGSLL